MATLLLIALVARAVVRQVTCASALNESTTCAYVDVANQPTPIAGPVQTAIANVCASGLMKGCGDVPAATPGATSSSSFWPGESVAREEMATFIGRGLHTGPTPTPWPTSTPVATDVPGSYCLANWIEQLAADGVTSTSGRCTSGSFCPGQALTRAEASQLLGKAFGSPCYV